ncbi:Retinol dehydrogenase 8 [Penicillium rolfsii]|nr:Retinol dehydrogenase 8 [Penicillium rolfsii]
MTNHHQQTWLITGASSGLGKSLALEVLKNGHTVLGTTREVKKAQEAFPEFEENGGTWLALDPGRLDAYERVVKISEDHDIDVVVNNAGFAFIGGVEDTSEDEVRSQMEVNFYGPLRVIRAVLPKMRAKRSGSIVLISSGAGFIARPSRGTYSASKFAIEAIHESLSQEVDSFGIRVLIVEPGAFRTPFASRIITPAKYRDTGGFSAEYQGTAVDQMVRGMTNSTEFMRLVKGDPQKAARAILNAVESGHEYLRLPLGADCVVALESKIESLQRDLELTREVARSTGADE